MFDGDALREARKRDGSAAQDRPAEVDEVLAPRERVGYKDELPLLDREYSAYPEGDELLRPSQGDTLRTLATHDMVGSVGDMAKELNTTEKRVRKAVDLHGINPDGKDFDVEVSTSRLEALVGDIPEGIVTSSNPITVAILYVDKGLSTDEIAEIMGEGVREAVVRQTLVDARVLPGETTEEAERRRKQW